MGLFSGGLIIRGSFALQKWFNLHLEGIFHLKMRDFASQNAVPEGMWIHGVGIELSCKYYLYAPKKNVQYCTIEL